MCAMKRVITAFTGHGGAMMLTAKIVVCNSQWKFEDHNFSGHPHQ